jgi:hypothetical protein
MNKKKGIIDSLDQVMIKIKDTIVNQTQNGLCWNNGLNYLLMPAQRDKFMMPQMDNTAKAKSMLAIQNLHQYNVSSLG